MLDATTLGGELAAMVKAQFSPVLDRIEGRMTALEKRLDEVPLPRDGKDAEPDAVASLVRGQIKGDLDALKASFDALSSRTVGLSEDQIKAMVIEAVSEAVGAIPTPKDGTSVTVDDVRPLIEDSVAKAVAAIPAPKDGVSLAGAIIDRDGNLVITLSNGEAKPLGLVVGRDGKGRDGIDGLGFDDMSLDYDGERTFTFRFERGEKVIERKFMAPVVLDRGVYRDGNSYEKGDAVTYGGSVWIAQGDTAEKPGSGAGWRLAVKAGRHGRDGAVKEAPAPKPVRVRGGGDAD